MRKLYYYRFQTGIHRSRVSITCDGTVGYPIRKFFEIPAFGSVLAGRFCRNAESLGFRHGETCFHLEEPAGVVKLARMLARDDSLARRVATAGQEMVREFHSVQARIGQFMMLAESLASRRFKTARWEAGRLSVIEEVAP